MAAPILKMFEAAGLTPKSSEPLVQNVDLLTVEVPNAFGGSEEMVVYVRSKAGVGDAVDASKQIENRRLDPRQTHLIFEATAEKMASELANLQPFRTTKSRKGFAVGVLRGLLPAHNLETSGEGQGRLYIRPRFIRDEQSGDNALQYLLDWTRGKINDACRVAVIKADGGLGKTQTAREIVRRITTEDSESLIPLLVNADQWNQISDQGEMSLWDIFRNSLDSASIPLVEEDRFYANLKEGVIIPVLDGFDELCTRKRRHFQPDSTIEELLDIADQGNGRILITTRAGYWIDNVSAKTRGRCAVVELQSFNKDRVNRFFDERLDDRPSRDRARTIVEEIDRKINRISDKTNAQRPRPFDRPTGIPAVLDMIAGAVEGLEKSDVVLQIGDVPGEEPMLSVIRSVCRRESQRQSLSASVDEQLNLFASLAIEYPDCVRAEDLALVAAGASESFEANPSEVLKLQAPHGLLKRGSEKDLFEFRFSFLSEYLRSVYVHQQWNRPAAVANIKNYFISNSSGEAASLDTLAGLVYRSPPNGETWKDAILSKCEDFRTETGRESHRALVGLWHLGCVILEQFSQGADTESRTKWFFQIFGDPADEQALIAKGMLSGKCTGVNFSRTNFECWMLDSVQFTNCTFSHKTVFRSCYFHGESDFAGCVGVKAIQLDDTQFMSYETRESFSSAKVGNGKSLLRSDDIIKAFRLAVEKFRRGDSFKTLNKENCGRGPIGRSPVRDEVWRSLADHNVTEDIRISGAGATGGLKIRVASMNSVRNFCENQTLSGNLKSAVTQVLKAHKID